MKYNSSNKPLICMQTQSTCYKGTSTMTVKGILWHSTGANNTTLKRYVQPSDVKPAADTYTKEQWLEILGKNKYNNDWNHIERQAGLNAWIGKLADGTVTTVQTMPWNYRPWGCGTGAKGSCNDGWIQFEICEDALTDAQYFNSVYTEACELTAYLCEMFNIDPKGTVEKNGVIVPTILCHADSYKLKLGSNHSDVNHWFPIHGKSMESARDDIAKLLKKPEPITPEVETELYRVRKTWEDVASQVGAYSVLENAIKACDKAGNDIYEVYDSKGTAVYPERVIIQEEKEEEKPALTFKVGDEVRLVPNAKYTSGKSIPSWLFQRKLYVREIRKNGDIVISTVKVGAITGVVNPKVLTPYSSNPIVEEKKFEPYLVKITADVLNVRAGAGTGYRINAQIRKNQVYTIIEEKTGWGKLKSGAGWISLNYTRRI